MDYTQTLDSMIQASYLGNLTELAELWGTMGLSREEIDTRMNTVQNILLLLDLHNLCVK